MGVYNTNSYNPLGSIQAALNNVNERNRIKNEYWKNKGQIWSNFANQLGQIGARTVDAMSAYSNNSNSLDARLAALEDELAEAQEAERVQAIQDKYNEQVAQRQAMDQYLKQTPQETLSNAYAEAMRGYRPNFAGYNMDQNRGGVYPEQEMEAFYRRGI